MSWAGGAAAESVNDAGSMVRSWPSEPRSSSVGGTATVQPSAAQPARWRRRRPRSAHAAARPARRGFACFRRSATRGHPSECWGQHRRHGRAAHFHVVLLLPPRFALCSESEPCPAVPVASVKIFVAPGALSMPRDSRFDPFPLQGLEVLLPPLPATGCLRPAVASMT